MRKRARATTIDATIFMRANARSTTRTARSIAARASREEEMMAKLMGMMGLGGDGIVAAADALPGRAQAMRVSDQHYVLKGHAMRAPFPENLERATFATGCFWGTEKVRRRRRERDAVRARATIETDGRLRCAR